MNREAFKMLTGALKVFTTKEELENRDDGDAKAASKGDE